MLLRLFILIFAVNAIIPSAFAVGNFSDCKMMMDQSSSMMTTASNTCTMSADSNQSCASLDCVSSCMINIVPMISVTKSFEVTPVPLQWSQTDFVFFYHIFYPVNTPPPLA